MDSPRPYFFSIVIPTLNEEKCLPRLLEDLSNQSFSEFEVIHVDAQSEDKTVQISKRFQQSLNLKVKSVSDRNVSKQRNLGAQLAKGHWIIFMDADNRLPHDFLSVLIKKLKSTYCDVFTCCMDNVHIENSDKPIMTMLNIWLKISARLKPTAPGAMIGIKNDSLKNLRFDENLYFAEDFDFLQQAKSHKLKFVVLDEPKYIYSLRRLKKDGSIKMIRVYSRSIINSFLTGQKFTSPLTDYPMLGGDYYSVPQVSLSKIQQLIETSSKVQLTKIKKLIDKFN